MYCFLSGYLYGEWLGSRYSQSLDQVSRVVVFFLLCRYLSAFAYSVIVLFGGITASDPSKMVINIDMVVRQMLSFLPGVYDDLELMDFIGKPCHLL